MIEIHNKSTYQRIYNKLSAVFIDSFVSYRVNGYATNEALAGAKIEVQSLVSVEMVRSNGNCNTLMKAYNSIKTDSDLIHQAIKYYQSMK